jgi:hypothetical protein
MKIIPNITFPNVTSPRIILPLPPEHARNENEAKEKIAWTNAMVDKEQALIDMWLHVGDDLPPMPPPTLEYAMKVYEETGDRSLLQQVQDLPFKLKGIRGRPRNDTMGDPIWEAVWDTLIIKRIWRSVWGNKYQSKHDGVVVTAEQIAMDRHKIKMMCDVKAFRRALQEPKRGRWGITSDRKLKIFERTFRKRKT